MVDPTTSELLRQLIHLANDVATGRYDRAGEVFEFTKSGTYPDLIVELAESFGLMIVKVEAREYQLEQIIAHLEGKNAELERTLRRVELLERVKGHLDKFVPESVRSLIETAPEAPDLDKHERDVSVLFLDVAGYSRMSERVACRDVDFLIQHYFSAFLDDIYANRGDINETTGDGLMILFLDPDERAHAANAVSTAVAISRRVQTLNRQLAGRFEPVSLRLGINSGQALVGSSRFEGLSGTRWTFTATGSVTNIAARLGALAEHGQILIGEETANRTRDRFRLQPLGPRQLRNVTEPVNVFRVLGEDLEPAASGGNG